ncbi:type I-E CRISPR-associated protein Cse2/CasB [Sphingomonas fuzhouensis]|uniref:type I-E CRISPR-associated protein Cse2/CasB n=1 Tax=Sphingomonas fuzhouensis TaxID=3106033 RepID=UPI002AFEE4BE|nr:type I-E CRISPR-associated protein Cse2/CasB [Sphingomonas sp. SGZ-02]
MASEAPSPAVPGAPPRDKGPIESIAGQIPYLSSRDHALLRRMYLTGRHEADGVVAALLVRAKVKVPTDPLGFAPWRLLAHCAALLSGTGKAHPHANGPQLGSRLHEIGLSENRLMRLVSARGSGLEAQVIRAMRMLAQHGKAPVNLHTLFGLIGHDPDQAEAARIRIAKDYYAAEARSEEGTSSDD